MRHFSERDVHRITWRGTHILRGVLARICFSKGFETSIHAHFAMMPTSSRGTRNVTSTVTHRPSLRPSGLPECSTVRIPCGL